MLTRSFQFIRPSREYRELAILTELGKGSQVSQRALARVAIVSPTMVNAYVDSLVASGLVEVTGETNRTYRYHVTPAGRFRRDELFFQVTREVIQFYGRTKEEFVRRLEEHYVSGVRRVVLFGAAETAELVLMASRRNGLRVIGIVDNDPAKHGQKLGDVVITSPDTIEASRPDAVIITSFGHMEEIFEQVKHLEGGGIRILRL